MATIKLTTNDKPSGMIGNLIYKQYKDKTVITAAPSRYRKPTDLKSFLKFEHFAILTSLSKKITAVPLLKPHWKRDDLKGVAAYHKFIGFNHDNVDADYKFKGFRLLPPGSDFHVDALSVEFTNEKIVLEINPLGSNTGINPAKEMYMGAVGFLMFTHSQGVPGKGPILYGTSELKATSLDVPLQFNIPFEDLDLTDLEGYDGITFAYILLTYNSEEKPVRWSETKVKIIAAPENLITAARKYMILVEKEHEKMYGKY